MPKIKCNQIFLYQMDNINGFEIESIVSYFTYIQEIKNLITKMSL